MVGPSINPDAGNEIASIADKVSELERIVRERESQTLALLDDGIPLGVVKSLDFLRGLSASSEGTRGFIDGIGSGKEYATVVVAASNTHASGRASADYVCDGVSDEQEINAAIQDVIDLGVPGGRVLCLEGDYTISGAGVLTPSTAFGVELAGLGVGTIFHSTAAFVVQIDGERCGARDLQVIGEGAGQLLVSLEAADVWALDVYALQGSVGFKTHTASTRQTLIRCTAEGQTTHGFVLDNTFCKLIACIAKECDLNGFRVQTPATDCTLQFCDAISCGTDGFNLSSDRVRVLGGLARLCGSSGVNIDCDRFKILVSHAILNANTGINVSGNSQDGVILGNDVMDNGTSVHNTFDGITILGDQCNVQQNTVRRGSGANQQRYGINVSGAGANANLVTNNDLLTSGATGSFNDTGTATVTAAGNRL